MITHNLFGFDVFSYKRLSHHGLGYKRLNIGGTNLTHINYGHVGGEVKFTNTIKYYQKSLAELASTSTED